MAECIFCTPEKLGKTIPLNPSFYLSFDSFPVAPGHCEIIPVNHRVSILDLNEIERVHFFDALDKTLELLKTLELKVIYDGIVKGTVNPIVYQYCTRIMNAPYFGSQIEHFNTGNNDGSSAGRTVDHFHFHVIPRFPGDIEYLRNEAGLPFDEIENIPRGGVRKILPFGDYKKQS